mmetsp:Transcript_12871/g.39291  ORF Transcript_12871/g.39291 Transcript_12871/m.39291 type:complete len:210 (+) Transcript_12871:90-719(+)
MGAIAASLAPRRPSRVQPFLSNGAPPDSCAGAAQREKLERGALAGGPCAKFAASALLRHAARSSSHHARCRGGPLRLARRLCGARAILRTFRRLLHHSATQGQQAEAYLRAVRLQTRCRREQRDQSWLEKLLVSGRHRHLLPSGPLWAAGSNIQSPNSLPGTRGALEDVACGLLSPALARVPGRWEIGVGARLRRCPTAEFRHRGRDNA